MENKNSKIVTFLYGVLIGLGFGIFIINLCLLEFEEKLEEVFEIKQVKTIEQLEAENKTLKLIIDSYDRRN